MIESGFRLTVAGRDAVMRSLIRAVYRFRDATLVNEKKDDFGSALQNLYRELERAENLAAQSFLAAWARDRKLKTRAREVLQLCSHPVIGWQDAPPGIFGLWFIQVAAI